MGRTHNQQRQRLAVDEDALQKIIVEGNTQLLIAEAEAFGGQLAKKDRLETSQIRNIFGTVRQIEMNWPRQKATEQQKRDALRQLLLLKPKMAYQANRKRSVSALQMVLDEAINKVAEGDEEKARERFQNFVDFFEAILAYHKAAGGKD